ncbi:MAG: 4'-phosphopantetheinyl transferase [Clostridiales bacterium]|nr:MAG: 4'-phosphopantetheinyl transferase [Clostridiales bacterium]
MIICAIKNYPKCDIDDSTALLGALDKGDLTRYRRYKSASAANQFLWGRLLLRYLLCHYCNFSNQTISFIYNEHGKPELANSSVFFNISHSDQWIVCAVDAYPVGIDIQRVGKWRPAVARRMATDEEYASLMAQSAVDRIKSFYALWTLKESYSKAIGTGLKLPFNSFDIKKSRSSRLFKTNDNYFLRQREIDCHYNLAICSANENFSFNITNIDPNKLKAYWTELTRRTSPR